MTIIPEHLKSFIIDQKTQSYSPVQQATWRFILRLLKDHLSQHAHPFYCQGLEATGITTEQIPQISDISESLKKVGWQAVAVSGFIPPQVFMEMQSLGLLPIAAEMRSLEHFMYTPAPDIVHEAAGHAPMLALPEYSEYLRAYAEVSKKAIRSYFDDQMYKAIRQLSDLKENPHSTIEQINSAQEQLEALNQQSQADKSELSEAAYLARMNWWTAEYGLIGDLENPKIYGAGLLSSLGESESCLKPEVKKIPLTLDALNYAYNITEPQPQLFVTPDFNHLKVLLEQMTQTMAYKTGGVSALTKALNSRLVNTVQLCSGLTISGILSSYKASHPADNQTTHLKASHQASHKTPSQNHTELIEFIKFTGPCQLGYQNIVLPEHGPSRHPQGISSPLGVPIGFEKPLTRYTLSELREHGISLGANVTLNWPSGYQLVGNLKNILTFEQKNLIFTFTQATLSFTNPLDLNYHEILFKPEWGEFDLLMGTKVTSVFGGNLSSDGNINQSAKTHAQQQPHQQQNQPPPPPTTGFLSELNSLHLQIKQWRDELLNDTPSIHSKSLVTQTFNLWSQSPHPKDKKQWLLTFEVYELLLMLKASDQYLEPIRDTINQIIKSDNALGNYIKKALLLLEANNDK